MECTFALAGYTFAVQTLYTDLQKLCKNYLSSAVPDVCFTVTQEEIDFVKKDFPDQSFRMAYYEQWTVYEKICTWLLYKNVLMFHSSALAVDGNAYLFTAPSGTGKSTHARLWRELLGDRVTMINDDKPLLKITDSEVRAYGTPWNGKHRIDTNISAPVRAICFLQQGKENRIRKMDVAELFPRMYVQMFQQYTEKNLQQAVDILSLLANRLPFYELTCNMELDAARLSYTTMASNAINGISPPPAH